VSLNMSIAELWPRLCGSAGLVEGDNGFYGEFP
jgi:hypothetical protein